MTPDEIKAKSAALTELYAAVSEGKTLQWLYGETFPVWQSCPVNFYPSITSHLHVYRIEPDPQRIWISGAAWTDSPAIASALKEVGQEAREFVEVLP